MGSKKEYYKDNADNNSVMLEIYLKVGREDFVKTFMSNINSNNEKLNEVEERYLDLIQSMVKGEKVEVGGQDAILITKIDKRTSFAKVANL